MMDDELKPPAVELVEGDRLVKGAYDAGDGWVLYWYVIPAGENYPEEMYWNYPDVPEDETIIDWPFGDRLMTASDLEEAGFWIWGGPAPAGPDNG